MSCYKEKLEQFLNDDDCLCVIAKFDSKASENYYAELRYKIEGNEYGKFCSEWIRKFSTFSHTNWITRRTFPKLKRLLFKKIFVCHHNSHNKRKPEISKKNMECQASIEFKIKFINKNTMKNDEYLKKGFNAKITISFVHTHPVEIDEVFRYLKCSPEVESQFYNYFNCGMTASAAKEYHETQLCIETCDRQLLTSGQLNPSMDHINYLYTKWKRSKYEEFSETNVHEVILQKKAKLEGDGFTIVYVEQPRIVVILSPIMKRAYGEGLAEKILFVDTISSSDQDKNLSYITFMYAANKTGCLPIACILHTQQTEADYTLAFCVTKDAVRNEYSHDKFEPSVLMTEDCTALRQALITIFPSSRLLLSNFNVNQDFWHWLWSNYDEVDKEEIHAAMIDFREILYSVTVEEAQKKYENTLQKLEVKRNEKLLNHLGNLWKTRTEWCLAYRNDVITEGHDTNNFTEASIRILKDIILQYCIVFNICTVLEFITTVLETYYQRRLLAFADGKETDISVYSSFEKRNEKFEKSAIGNYQIQIRSNREPNIIYTVYTDTATCDCVYGRSGMYCKHMYNIDKEAGSFVTSALEVEDRILLAKLAFGEDIKEDFCKNIIENDNCGEKPSTSSEKAPPPSNPLDLPVPMEFVSVTNNDDTDTESFKNEFEGSLFQLQNAFCKFSNVLRYDESLTSLTCIKRMTKLLESANTTEEAYEILQKLPQRVTRNIKVESTSVRKRKVKGVGKKS